MAAKRGKVSRVALVTRAMAGLLLMSLAGNLWFMASTGCTTALQVRRGAVSRSACNHTTVLPTPTTDSRGGSLETASCADAGHAGRTYRWVFAWSFMLVSQAAAFFAGCRRQPKSAHRRPGLPCTRTSARFESSWPAHSTASPVALGRGACFSWPARQAASHRPSVRLQRASACCRDWHGGLHFAYHLLQSPGVFAPHPSWHWCCLAYNGHWPSHPALARRQRPRCLSSGSPGRCAGAGRAGSTGLTGPYHIPTRAAPADPRAW